MQKIIFLRISTYYLHSANRDRLIEMYFRYPVWLIFFHLIWIFFTSLFPCGRMLFTFATRNSFSLFSNILIFLRPSWPCLKNSWTNQNKPETSFSSLLFLRGLKIHLARRSLLSLIVPFFSLIQQFEYFSFEST